MEIKIKDVIELARKCEQETQFNHQDRLTNSAMKQGYRLAVMHITGELRKIQKTKEEEK